jgi:alkylated DNA nucleotide flippase Atl1/predicted nuclease with RNAse H fold
MFVGVDVSATRGFDVAILDEDRRLTLLAKARDLDALAVIARGIPPESIVAIDAPPAPSRGLVAGGKRYRVAEEELHRLGVSLYPTPPSEEEAAWWMRIGFSVFELMEKMGFPPSLDGSSRRGAAIEVYPHLTYRTLSGSTRGRGPKIEWSRRSLHRRVAGVPRGATQDQLDAVAAALTAWFFAHDRFVAHGDPREGVIVAPRVEGAGEDDAADAGQLSLELGSAPAPRAKAGPVPTSAPGETPFAARVLALVKQIPPGAVTTFGDLARWSGASAGARAVGTLVARHAFEVPCHRVLDAAGRASPAYPGGADAQLARLAAEGVPIKGTRVDLSAVRWRGPS